VAKNKMLQAVVSLAGTIDPSLGKALDDVTGKLENVNWKAVAVGGAVGGIAVATGKAVVEAGKYLADLGNEYNTAINQLSAATGATGDELDALGESVKDIYAQGLGDDFADVADGQRRELAADMPVSMNFWGFMPSIFDQMEEYLDDFLRALPPEEIKAECLLPNMVGDLLKKGRLSVSVLHSADRWFGMTYHQDRQAVARELARLHENGTYPPTLRS
jgi:hypothetical protein